MHPLHRFLVSMFCTAYTNTQSTPRKHSAHKHSKLQRRMNTVLFEIRLMQGLSLRLITIRQSVLHEVYAGRQFYGMKSLKSWKNRIMVYTACCCTSSSGDNHGI